MENQDTNENEIKKTGGRPKDIDAWAAPVSRLKVGQVPLGAQNLNVDGRQLASPLQGFGQLWQRTYRIRIAPPEPFRVTPEQVVGLWKERLPELMPSNNRFYPSVSGVKPGEVVLINASMPIIPGGMPVDTGVLVVYVDEVSFTVMTPEGHPESGFNTFSAYEENGTVYGQVQSLSRSADPIYEVGYMIFNFARSHDAIWINVLLNLAAQFGVSEEVTVQKQLVDKRWQWSKFGNIRHNAAIRTFFYNLRAPIRWLNRQQ